MRLVLVDDHEMFRDGLRFIFDQCPLDCEITEAATLDVLRSIPAPETVDLVLLDYRLPGVSGLEGLVLTRQLFPEASIVVVSGEDDGDTIRNAIRCGASGFIPKSSSAKLLLAALQVVLAGGTYLPPDIMSREEKTPAGSGSAEQKASLMLSARQMEVLKLAIQGKPNKAIARELNISDHTVKVHLSVALRALGVRNRTEAVIAAARLGISELSRIESRDEP